MKISYRLPKEYIPVEVSKMRTKDSYKNLIKKRTWAIDALIKKFGTISEELLSNRNCPSCDSNENELEIEKDHLKIVKCKNCSTVFVNPIFSEEHYRKTYESEDYKKIFKAMHEDSHEYRKERFGKERVAIMKEWFPGKENLSFLDIGCASGFIVEAAQDAGMDAWGVDFSPNVVEFGKKRGLNLMVGGLEVVPTEKKFDVIALFDVLEHVVNPKELILECEQRLNEGGIIFLYLPNYASAIINLLGKDAHIIWPTEHLTYWTPETIVDFFDHVGMKVEWQQTEGLDLVDYIWRKKEEGKDMSALEEIQDKLQFFINAGMYGVNLRVIAKRKK